MGTTKLFAHSLRQNRIARLYKALGHPARIAILEYISKHPECICNDIVSDIELAQATISQHLNELKRAGLIRGESRGKKIYYSINIDKWYETHQISNNFFRDAQKVM
ncbi:metalloregulator ArsR/SmtB family transcription factor [Leptobacterium flavescens]|uniref:Metalloregulator ArsR/SmtB family transcription factor n=1 Tax=Leptobacterium flavescens TaxID=472055 RepID=A0A6P0UR83_9FLAO|nr:metalloregulator ArsR/SmtB family transcription factor [Leptobacterium flavescens]NER12926.1 metalloregulator ArsR/SmtB family transcription factor [Leptobacterium flavescens]